MNFDAGLRKNVQALVKFAKLKLDCDRIDQSVIGSSNWLIFQNILPFVGDLLNSRSTLNESKLIQLLLDCEVVLDIIWEHLNIGHWKNVKTDFRIIFGYVSLFKIIILINCSKDYLQILKTCDIGLLTSPPILNNVLSSIASLVHTHLTNVNPLCSSDYLADLDYSQDNYPICSDKKVLRVNCPSVDEFLGKYFLTSTPVIIKNAIDFWPCFDFGSKRKWNLEYIINLAGYRTVPVEIGSKYTDFDWSQKLMQIKDIIQNYFKPNSPKGYIAQLELFEKIRELGQDIGIPDYCGVFEENEEENDDIIINAWFGPKGTVSPLHQDSYHNLLVQVLGSKYIRLYTHQATSYLYPYPSFLLSNTSQVDVENPNYQKFSQFKEADFQECILREGEMLFIPRKYWHFIKSLSISFSISYWWNKCTL